MFPENSCYFQIDGKGSDHCPQYISKVVTKDCFDTCEAVYACLGAIFNNPVWNAASERFVFLSIV